MAVSARGRRPEPPKRIRITFEIEDFLTHYAFGERFAFDGRMRPALSEMLMVNVWGSIIEPKEKSGRDLQATISASDRVADPPMIASDAGAPEIGELHWGKDRVVRVDVPPHTLWPLAQSIASGHLKRMSVSVADQPLRGSLPIYSLHILTRKLELKIG